MRKVYASDDFLLVGHLRQVLENHHVHCVVRNEHLIGGAGELPPIECWPELWIVDDDQWEKARALVDACLPDRSRQRRPWCCPGCGESLEGQFTECWRCGAPRPDAPG